MFAVYQELTREMNDRERVFLEEVVSDPRPVVTFTEALMGVLVWAAGLLFCGLLMAGLIVLDMSPVLKGLLGGLVGMVAILCLYLVVLTVSSYVRWSRIHKNFVQEGVPKIRDALQDGHVQVKRVRARAVVEIEEFEDEGLGYLYDVGDGRFLFLKGQKYFPEDEEAVWPNSEFEIVRTVVGHGWLGIFCYGEELVPIRKILSSECPEEVAWSEREELLEVNLEELAESIAKSV